VVGCVSEGAPLADWSDRLKGGRGDLARGKGRYHLVALGKKKGRDAALTSTCRPPGNEREKKERGVGDSHHVPAPNSISRHKKKKKYGNLAGLGLRSNLIRIKERDRKREEEAEAPLTC